jgi:hypothetical protein
MKPFRDAIKAIDSNAVVALFFSDAGNPNRGWDNSLTNNTPKYWDAVTYNHNTTTNMAGLNFGFFLSAQAAGEAVANGALYRSTGIYPTTTTGGSTVPIYGGSNVPAVYAQAYQGGNGKRYVVVINKGASNLLASIKQDGVTQGNANTNKFLETFVTGSDPSLTNSSPPPYSVTWWEWQVFDVPRPSLTLNVPNAAPILH